MLRETGSSPPPLQSIIFRSKVQATWLPITLMFICVTPLILYIYLWCRKQRSAIVFSPFGHIRATERYSDCSVTQGHIPSRIRNFAVIHIAKWCSWTKTWELNLILKQTSLSVTAFMFADNISWQQKVSVLSLQSLLTKHVHQAFLMAGMAADSQAVVTCRRKDAMKSSVVAEFC